MNFKMSRLGDPATRPEAEDCLVQSTRVIDDRLRDWDTTGAVTWAVHGPESTGPAEMEAAIREEFNLRHDEVKVTCHFPESFLIKFKYARHCTVALKKGSAKRRGIEVFFSPSGEASATPKGWPSSSTSSSISTASRDTPGQRSWQSASSAAPVRSKGSRPTSTRRRT